MIKWLIIGCAVIFVELLSPQVYAGAVTNARLLCEKEARETPPELEIVYNFGNLQYDYSLSGEQLKERVRKTHPDKVSHTINGLTDLSPYIAIEGSIVQSGDRQYLCYYPKKIRVRVGFEPVVHISSDIKQGSCRYKVTMRHEQTHLDIGNLALMNFLEQIKEEFPQIIKKVGIMIKPYSEKVSAEEQSNELNNIYSKEFGYLFNSFIRNMVTQQMRIDTDESYRNEGKLCASD